MHKCDICGTTIPYGTDRCPSCGYRYRPERKMSEVGKKARKEAYMSQFQPHPSPLDGLKNKENIDFSKVYDTITKSIRPVRKVENRRKSGIFLGKMVAIIVVLVSLISSVFPLIIDFISDIEEPPLVDVDNEYIYEWVYSYDELEDEYYDYAMKAKPYYDYVMEFVNEDGLYGHDSLYESYCVDSGELDYVDLTASLVYENVECDLVVALFDSDDPWQETFYITTYVGDEPALDKEAIEALVYFSGITYDELYNHFESTFDEMDGPTFEVVSIGDATLIIDYIDGYIDYSISRTIELN